MLPSGTSIAQRSPLCGRPVLTTDWLLADLWPKRSRNAASICNLHQNCSHTLFPAKLFFFLLPLLSLKGTRCLWKTSLSRMTGVLAGKELIGLIRHLDFGADNGQPRVVLCTGQHQGPANTGAGSADRPDYHSLTWVTVATGAREQRRHRGQMF